jgi:RNA polymerase sigma-70 factor (ECF subfamily)
MAHQGPLARHAQALLGEGGPWEDAVQEALLRLAKSPPELPAGVLGNGDAERSVLSSWLHKVTRNCCMDTLRSEGSRRHREREAAAAESISGGLERVEGRDTRRAVKDAMAGLPQDQREVLTLRLLGERTYTEIAEITGKKRGTIGWLISTGLTALSLTLEPMLGLGAIPAGASPAVGGTNQIPGQAHGEKR